MVFRAVVFTFLPTVVELLMVCYLLSAAFSPKLVLIVMTTFVIYVAWTVVWTSQAARLRKEVRIHPPGRAVHPPPQEHSPSARTACPTGRVHEPVATDRESCGEGSELSRHDCPANRVALNNKQRRL